MNIARNGIAGKMLFLKAQVINIFTLLKHTYQLALILSLGFKMEKLKNAKIIGLLLMLHLICFTIFKPTQNCLMEIISWAGVEEH